MVANLKIFVAHFLLLLTLGLACGKSPAGTDTTVPVSADSSLVKTAPTPAPLRLGAERTAAYLPRLQGKNVALMVNQTSVIGQTHLVDSLLALGVNIQQIFAPEHGFRGQADAGEQIKDGQDVATGLPVLSLYGSKKKPAPADLAGVDIVVFDIQDVGARFYTYISAMSYLMEACAENGLPLLVLDRPNPNGHLLDGPVMQPGFTSYVGLHPGVPVAHGMTVGEYARMVNGEGWLARGQQCELTVVSCENYSRDQFYELPVKPSPNLPNIRSILLYPSICFFEGTQVSVGRGTDHQFQVLGMPGFPAGDYSFVPKPMPGAKHPKYEGTRCSGLDLTARSPQELHQSEGINLDYLLFFYQNAPDQSAFFLPNNFFDKLAGNELLRQQIKDGVPAAQIRASWQPGLERFRALRKPYLLYD